MRTPSLHRRLVAGGVGTVVLLALFLDVLLFVSWRSNLLGALDDQLDDWESLVRGEAPGLDAAGLAQRIDNLGLTATVRSADGDLFDAGRPHPTTGTTVDRDIELPSGNSAVIWVSRLGADESLRRLLTVEAIGTLTVASLAFLLLRMVSDLALKPLDDMSSAIRRTAAGHRGERLQADQPSTKLGELATAYDHMLDALETALSDADLARDESRRFLADAAHQLRTPVAGILACTEALLLGTDPAENDELLALLASDSARTGRLITSLLQTARLDQGLEPALHHCDVVALCEEEVGRSRSLAPRLAIQVHPSGMESRSIELDGHMVREILANLLDNARRHARSKIDVSVTVNTCMVELRVFDDGAGLAADSRERAFVRFVSLDGQGGSGLGLPIARGLAEAHGGHLTYEENSFVLRLPASMTQGSLAERSY